MEQEVEVAARLQEKGEAHQALDMFPHHQHLFDQNLTATSESKSVLESESEGVAAALPEELLREEETANKAAVEAPEKQVAEEVPEEQVGGGHSPRPY